MKKIFKLATGLAVVALFLSACAPKAADNQQNPTTTPPSSTTTPATTDNTSPTASTDDVYAYSQAVTAADDKMGTALSTAIDGMSAEMDKEKPDLTVLEKLDGDITTAIRDGVAEIKALTPPNGAGVKDFHDALLVYLQETENFAKAGTNLIASFKTKDVAAIDKARTAYLDQIQKVTDVAGKLQTAQQAMANLNS